jgi:fatty acid-binding protein DegV
MLGAALRTKPVLDMQDGELDLTDVKRTRRAAKQCLCDFVSGLGAVEEAAVLYTTTPDEAEAVGFHLREHFPDAAVYVTEFGPWLGLHLGPGAIGVAARARKEAASRSKNSRGRVEEPQALWARHWRSIA